MYLIGVLILLFNIHFAYGNCLGPATCLEEVQSVATGQPMSDCSLPITPPSEASVYEETSGVEANNNRITFDRKSWKYALAGIGAAPLSFMAGVSIHEGTHCLVANATEGAKCGEVRLIPYYDEELDYFYFGSMQMLVDPENPPSAKGDMIITASPMMVNAGLISVYSTLAFTNKLPKNKWLKTGALLLGASQVVDLFNHVGNEHPYSDSGKIINYLQTEQNLNPQQAYWSTKGPQIAFATVGASAIGLEMFRIFTKREDPVTRSGRNIRLTPSLGPGTTSIGLSGEF